MGCELQLVRKFDLICYKKWACEHKRVLHYRKRGDAGWGLAQNAEDSTKHRRGWSF